MSYRVVVLASGVGTLLQAIIDAQTLDPGAFDLVAVGSDLANCDALHRAQAVDLPTFVVPMPAKTRRGSPARSRWDDAMVDAITPFQPDLIVLAGFMRILGPAVLQRFGRIINSHPSLLPAFPGAHAVSDALAAGVDHTGMSIFWVDEGVDTGRLITQHLVPVRSGDNEETLHERIKVTERVALVETIKQLAQEKGTK